MGMQKLQEPISVADYLSFYGLSHAPFDEVRNPRFFFASSEHQEALERLQYIIEDGNMNFGMLTGEIGSGKTLTRTVLERNLSPNDFFVLCLENTFFNFEDLLFEIQTRISQRPDAAGFEPSLGKAIRGDKYGLVKFFQEYVENAYRREGRRLVLILDEAQSISRTDLDQLKNLTNIAWEDTNLVTILLVGQPELRQHVRGLRQVDQRVGLSFHLNNLDLKNLKRYVSHRLVIAGHSDGNLFGQDACEMLFRHTLGIPREINRACKLALEYGFANDLEELDKDAMKVVLDDIHRHRV